MGIKTNRQEVYWRVDYVAINFDTPHMHARLLGWETRQDWLDKKPAVFAQDFYFENKGYLLSKDAENEIKQACYGSIKNVDKWSTAEDVIETVPEEKIEEV